MDEQPRPLRRLKTPTSHKLPVELFERILSHTKDWELCHTLGFPHALPASSVWLQHATDLDWAVLSGSLALVQACLDPAAGKTADQLQLSTWGARAIVRFGYIDTLTFLYDRQQKQLLRCVGSLLPTIASAWGRVNVLEWAQTRQWQWLQDPNPDPINEASRHGQTHVLDWWKKSGLPLHYSEDALKSATVKRQLDVLEWWKHSGLPLKVGTVLDFASMGSGDISALEWWASNMQLGPKHSKTALYALSCTGHIDGLNWWWNSGLALLFDKEVLLGATKHGQVEALQWWLDKGVPLEFRFFDIEEALEEETAPNTTETLNWWAQHGYKADSEVTDWMKVRTLKPQI